MSENKIPDSALTASSQMDDLHAAKNARYNLIHDVTIKEFPLTSRVLFRVRVESGGGAWCPEHLIDRNTYEYLQIDLSRLKVLRAVETQGKFGSGRVRQNLVLIF